MTKIRTVEIGSADSQNNNLCVTSETLENSEIYKVLIMISNCVAMNVENGVNMAGVIFLKAKWKNMEFNDQAEIQADIEKSIFVITKLAIEFGLIQLVGQSKYCQSVFKLFNMHVYQCWTMSLKINTN